MAMYRTLKDKSDVNAVRFYPSGDAFVSASDDVTVEETKHTIKRKCLY